MLFDCGVAAFGDLLERSLVKEHVFGFLRLHVKFRAVNGKERHLRFV